MSSPAASTTPDPTLALVPDSVRTRRTAVAFDAGVLLRITRMAFAHPWRMALGMGATVLAACAQLVVPQLIGEAVDHAQGLLAAAADDAEARAALVRAASLILVVSVFRGLCTMMQNYQGEAVGQLIAYRMRLELYAKVQALSFSYHDRVHTGDLMTRGILDIEGTKLWVSTGVQRSVLLAILVGGGAWLLTSIDALLGCLALSFAPLVAVGASLARLRLRTLWYALQEELAVLTRVMEENLGGIRVVRAFVSQTFEMARFDAISTRALSLAHRRIGVFVKSTTTMTFAYFVSMGLVLWVGGEKVLSRGADHRGPGLVPRVHGHPPDAGAPDRVDGELGGADLDLRWTAVRGARPGAGDPGPARCARARNPGRGGPLRERVLQLPQGGQGPAGAARRELRGPTRAGHRHRGPARQRQVDHRPPPAPLLRRGCRERHHRRPGRARRDARLAPSPSERGAAGSLPVHRRDRQQRELRRPVGGAERGSAGHRGGAAPQIRRAVAGGLRDPGRRARSLALRRAAPAPRHRAQRAPHLERHRLRRLHRGGRRRHRTPDSRSARRRDPRPARSSSSPTASRR